MLISATIREKLSHEFSPTHLDVINESDNHNVPKGSESHFKVVIVSSVFEQKRLLARHRLVNHVLADELSRAVHALAIHTYTPQEWAEVLSAPGSPACMDGFHKG